MNSESRRPLALTLIATLLITTMTLPGRVLAGSLMLNWEDNSANEEGFYVERETQNRGKKKFVQIAVVGPDTDSYIDSAIESGTTYCYRVSAFNVYGSSDYSAKACGTYELIANAGQSQTISDSDANGVETVTLDGSGSYGAIVSYEWTDAANVIGNGVTLTQDFAVGSRNVSLTVTDTDGSIDSDGVLITILAHQSTTTAVVDNISYTTKGGKNLRLTTTVSVIESIGSVLANAMVTLDLLRDGALVTSQTLTSKSDGSASFNLSNASAGCYETIILEVIAEGLTWDGVTPANRYCLQEIELL